MPALVGTSASMAHPSHPPVPGEKEMSVQVDGASESLAAKAAYAVAGWGSATRRCSRTRSAKAAATRAARPAEMKDTR